MKTILLLICTVLVFTLAGCGKSEETSPSIVPYQGSVLSARYTGFSKIPVTTTEPDPDGVSFEGIGFAADGDIMVTFKAPGNQSELWQQDYIYIVDETTKGVYKDIPVAPIVGPLIGRPVDESRPGYVMLLNYYNGVKNGSVVTVVLGNYKREHVRIQVDE